MVQPWNEDGESRTIRPTPQEFSTAMEANNVIVDAVARLGATEKEMAEIADLMEIIVRGKAVKEEILALRSRLKLSYAFPA